MGINLIINSVDNLDYLNKDRVNEIKEIKEITKVRKVEDRNLEGEAKRDKAFESEKKKDLKEAVASLNKLLERENAKAEYTVHDKFGDIMVKVVDEKTKKVILEVPPQKILDLVAKLCELSGVVLDKRG